ncbi:bifunctional 2-polyprenyl-6-hydroxyphenol methylase/3-demethylubiquinol 3-O-methyltransferase UbiG [Ciceribacter sp. RN22]|uniref:class I SAM-dependent methyltransferase n=1 Tax=Ciceribacter sp. RN22 TaxID=2954932 RepID=UPI002093A594|nr:class I SAM-dependent methyltransferase [Ciceribacter sp. RN22]MCO6176764.1 class I SAM-dependent methyltransferase [Ciceribacter sp. RN22]
MPHDPSLAFYEANAGSYAVRRRSLPHDRLEAFLGALVPGSRILELGCGAGDDSAAMLARGFDVVPTDGSAAMAQQAEIRLRRPVRVMLFSELDASAAYDGVWANACLLHVPLAELPSVIGKIRRALRPSGLFYASFKAGQQEGCDRFGRYYNRPAPEWLIHQYRMQGFAEPVVECAHGGGYDGVATEWLHVVARPA